MIASSRLAVVVSVVVVFAWTVLAPTTARAVTYAESTDGDLSGNPSSPTALGTFAIGTHSVTATSGSSDQDNFSFVIPVGAQLSSLVNSFYDSGSLDDVSFMSINIGPSIPDQGQAPGNLLGYLHFGPGTTAIGADLLPEMGQAFGAQGFTPPLPANTYSMWTQQAGPASTYTLVFTVTPVPEPAAAGVVLIATGMTLARRRRV